VALRTDAFPSPDPQVVTLSEVEFTSLCPKTGQPDFGSVAIEYTPDGRRLEPRSWEKYLWSFRDVGAFCESIAAQIADDIVYAIAPKHVRVRVSQNARGGIAITSIAERTPVISP